MRALRNFKPNRCYHLIKGSSSRDIYSEIYSTTLTPPLGSDPRSSSEIYSEIYSTTLTPPLGSDPRSSSKFPIYVSKPHFLDGIVSFAFRLRRRAKGEAGDYQKQGYKVDLYWLEEDEEIFKSMWNKDGIYGVVFAGHGSKGGYIADDSGFEVNPFTISLKYKLAIVHAYSCYSADSLITGNSTADGGQEYDTWRNKVSKEGEFIGYSGWAFHWSDPVTAR